VRREFKSLWDSRREVRRAKVRATRERIKREREEAEKRKFSRELPESLPPISEAPEEEEKSDKSDPKLS